MSEIKSVRYSAENLWDELATEHTIMCSNCRVTDNIHNANDEGAAEYFFRQGWRKTKENCYCPKCASIKLKSKK